MPIVNGKRRLLALNRELQVDYPKQNEVLSGAFYSVRVSAPPEARDVQICIDQGDWKSCRPAVGFWWYDWSGFGDGEHEICARVTTKEGRQLRSEAREFFVATQRKPALAK